jgi:hypothetical protein
MNLNIRKKEIISRPIVGFALNVGLLAAVGYPKINVL